MGRRPDPSADAVSKESIYDAALKIVKRHGLDGLNIRSLCEATDRKPPAVYRLIGSKQLLVDELFDRVIGSAIGLTSTAGAWEDSLTSLILAVRDRLVEYPGLASAVRNSGPSSTSLRLTEEILGLLAQGGIHGADGIFAWYLLDTYFFGHLLVQPGQVAGRRATPKSPNRTIQLLRTHRVDEVAYPRLAAASPSLALHDDQSMFAQGLRRIIAGIGGH